MSDLPFDDEAKSFESLSALADGQATEHEIAQACAAWRGQDASRARWHAYQLIGDVMRSESLAETAQADQAFLETFRARLAQEPVVLAPAALTAAAAVAVPEPAVANLSYPLHRRRWAGPVAVAAGFVMVLGAVVTTLNPEAGSGSSPNAPLLAQGARDAVVPVSSQGWVGQESTAALAPTLRTGLVADSTVSRQPVEEAPSSFSRNTRETAAERAGKLVIIRDPQLDEFLAAHRELTSSGTFVPPAGLVRGVAFEAPAGR